MSRWIRVQTSIFDHELFASAELSQREAWLWLIANVAWKETRHRIGNEVLDVPVGSMFVTLRSLQSAWHWGSDKRVRTFLSMLENERMIETKTDAGKTQITVCNYSRYQDVGRTEDASGTHAGRSADALKTPVHQDTNTSSLRSDDKRTPRDELSTVLDADHAQAVLDHRQRSRKPLTAHAAKLLAGKFGRCADPNAAADAMIANGWQGFEPEWLERRQQPQAQSQAPPQKSAFQQSQDRIYQQLKRETGDRDDQFAGTTLDIGPGDYHPH